MKYLELSDKYTNYMFIRAAVIISNKWAWITVTCIWLLCNSGTIYGNRLLFLLLNELEAFWLHFNLTVVVIDQVLRKESKVFYNELWKWM